MNLHPENQNRGSGNQGTNQPQYPNYNNNVPNQNYNQPQGNQFQGYNNQSQQPFQNNNNPNQQQYQNNRIPNQPQFQYIPPKSNNNVLIFVLAGVCLILLGVAGYFIVDKLTAKSKVGEVAATERPEVQQNINYVPGSYPEGSTRILTYDDIANKSAWELKIMRNEIFGRHGYIFKSKDLQDYFALQTWYSPVYENVGDKLTNLELNNIMFIKKYEY